MISSFFREPVRLSQKTRPNKNNALTLSLRKPFQVSEQAIRDRILLLLWRNQRIGFQPSNRLFRGPQLCDGTQAPRKYDIAKSRAVHNT